MKLTSAIRKLFGITFLHGTGPGSWGPALAWLRGDISSGEAAGLYSVSATLQGGLSRIAADAASIGWEAVRKTAGGEEKVVPNHPIVELLKNPNPSVSGAEFFYAMFLIDQIYGEVFLDHSSVVLGRPGALAVSGGDRTAGGMQLLHPSNVKHEIRRGVLYWSLNTADGYVALDPDEFIHVARYNPDDRYSVRGLSKLKSVLIEIGGDIAAAEWNYRFFANQNGVPTGVVIPSLQGSNTKEERESWFDRWTDRLGGNRGVGLLPPGWTFQEIGVNPRDMNFRALREYAREQALGLIGVPPFYAGVLDKANYANAREQKEVYWNGTITNALLRFTAAFNHRLLPRLGVTDVTVRPNWEQVKALLEDLAEKTDVATKWFAMGLSKRVINERLEMGWSEKLIEDYEVGYLPFGIVPVDQVGMLPAADEATDTEGTDTPEDGDDENEQGDREGEEPRSRPTQPVPVRRMLAGAREERRARVWRAIDRQARDLETQYERTVRRHMEILREDVVSRLRSLKRYRRRGPLDDTKDWINEFLFESEDADRRLVSAVAPVVRLTFKRGGESVLMDLGGAGTTLDLFDPRVAAKITELTLRIRGINRTLERQVREALGEAVGAGETIDSMVERINQVFSFGKNRARTIAVTETGSAYSSARFESMRQNGVTKHQWLSARLPNVREDHADEDGAIVDIGTPFPVTSLRYPKDPAGAAAQIINCRCVAIPEVA